MERLPDHKVTARLTKEQAAIQRNRRTDAMFVAAYMGIFWIVYLIVYAPELDEFAKGAVTLVLGMFVRELSGMYAFENGTTRASQNKDATIKNMAEGK